jgi:hypothetical protein
MRAKNCLKARRVLPPLTGINATGFTIAVNASN